MDPSKSGMALDEAFTPPSGVEAGELGEPVGDEVDRPGEARVSDRRALGVEVVHQHRPMVVVVVAARQPGAITSILGRATS